VLDRGISVKDGIALLQSWSKIDATNCLAQNSYRLLSQTAI